MKIYWYVKDIQIFSPSEKQLNISNFHNHQQNFIGSWRKNLRAFLWCSIKLVLDEDFKALNVLDLIWMEVLYLYIHLYKIYKKWKLKKIKKSFQANWIWPISTDLSDIFSLICRNAWRTKKFVFLEFPRNHTIRKTSVGAMPLLVRRISFSHDLSKL